MPRGDRTGPMGMGPMTGRGAGYCSGAGVPGYMNPSAGGGAGWGRGRGFGRGMGRGWGRGGGWGYGMAWGGGGPVPGYGFPAYGSGTPVQPSPEQEMEILRGQARHFEEGLEEIRKRIQALEQEST